MTQRVYPDNRDRQIRDLRNELLTLRLTLRTALEGWYEDSGWQDACKEAGDALAARLEPLAAPRKETP